MNWPKGSKWRKWDLHVHSPASHGFAGDWNQFIIRLDNADCDVRRTGDYAVTSTTVKPEAVQPDAAECCIFDAILECAPAGVVIRVARYLP